jgi:hypothetical protein
MIANVEADGVNGGSSALQGLRGDLGKFTGAAACKQQARSLGREGQRGSRANAGAGSRNEDDLSPETHDSILEPVMNFRRSWESS